MLPCPGDRGAAASGIASSPPWRNRRFLKRIRCLLGWGAWEGAFCRCGCGSAFLGRYGGRHSSHWTVISGTPHYWYADRCSGAFAKRWSRKGGVMRRAMPTMLWWFAAVVLWGAAGAAVAQVYPAKPIRFFVPY